MSDSQRDAGASDRSQRGFLDYYGARGVIPVSQTATGPDVRRRQRLGLYRTLGIPAIAFRGSRVIEFGPGTGDNSEIAASLGPASFDLVDGNDASLRALAAKLADGRLDPAICRLVRADFNDERIDGVTPGSYDVVIAEGCIPGQVDPVATLRRVAQYAAPDGMLIVTSVDSLSMLPEFCCKLAMAPVLLATDGDFERAISIGSEVFEPHLGMLSSRSRSVRDWIIDVLLHPLPERWALSIDTVVDSLSEFDVHGSSPDFSTDWRWYKDVEDRRDRSNRLTELWRSVAYLTLDHRVEPHSIAPLTPALHQVLHEVVARIDAATFMMTTEPDLAGFGDVADAFRDLSRIVAAIPGMERTVASIDDFRRSIPVLAAGRWDYEYGDFLGWFGRGQQYLAMARSAD
jgi:SAM-dependent methyltransferase